MMSDFRDPCLTSAVVWEITSLQIEISSIRTKLRTQVDACQQQTGMPTIIRDLSTKEAVHND